LLPHFGPERNPFGSGGNSDAAPSETPSPGRCCGNGVAQENRNSPPSNSEVAAALQIGTKGRPLAAIAKDRRFAGSARLKTAAFVSAWAAKLFRLVKRPRSAGAKSVVPRFEKQPVQGELSLESIKVVRNDLSDADLEVVPARPPAAPASPAAGPKTGTPVAQSTWGRVTTRIFRAGKS
ncbi:MAG: hypothetical protein NT154_45310, partial [Verrucomicrobia bacterium]|nr:hypothetical protein [Verrucomicrobiota bacterium]